MPEVVVIGAGVIGLSVAVRLREAGVAADVWAEQTSPGTTSDVAAALWYPYRALPEALVTRWAARTYDELLRLVDVAGAGVVLRDGTELFVEPVGDPWWRDAVPGFRRARGLELRPGYRDGYRFVAPVAEMPTYMRWLADRLAALGGTVVRRRVASLDQPLATADVVVNCAGLGARELVPDPVVVPVRGQVVLVAQVGLDEWVVDEHGPRGMTYVVPRSADIVVGGTADVGREDAESDPLEAERLLTRALLLEPRLSGARVLGHRAGLRPGRPTVRLERVGRVVHCYGHGGAGVTLSWGCAADVVSLVTSGRGPSPLAD
jgi:D-amino-acid oxidase